MSSVDAAALTAFLQKRFSGIEAVSLTEDGILLVETSGVCASCPMHSLTLEQDIMGAVANEFPSVKQVQAGPAISKETMNMVRKILRGEK